MERLGLTPLPRDPSISYTELTPLEENSPYTIRYIIIRGEGPKDPLRGIYAQTNFTEEVYLQKELSAKLSDRVTKDLAIPDGKFGAVMNSDDAYEVVNWIELNSGEMVFKIRPSSYFEFNKRLKHLGDPHQQLNAPEPFSLDE